jgi:cyclophilin family peptidyl-prolyl cis-trans isomerase
MLVLTLTLLSFLGLCSALNPRVPSPRGYRVAQSCSANDDIIPRSSRQVIENQNTNILKSLLKVGGVLMLDMSIIEGAGVLPTLADGAPEITDKVKLEIKIANYTEESIGRNRGAKGSGSVTIGLYGKAAPEHVKRFLNVIQGDGVTTPNYANALFYKITPTGLMEMDKVKGIRKVEIAGQEQYEYNGNILSEYTPLLENNGLSHNRKGLLSAKQLASTPEFSITLNDSPSKDQLNELDTFHCIFGEVLSGFDVLQAIYELPTYSYETSTGYGGRERGVESGIADKWFSSQREFYVNVGKSFGDARAVDLRGKLLRRVQIKDFQVIN